jgi:hypothetical protein
VTEDARFQQVTCSGCGRSYVCSPVDDYYNSTNLEDGVCERCLLGGKTGAKKPEPKITPLLKSALDGGAIRLSAELAEEMGVDLQGNPKEEK